MLYIFEKLSTQYNWYKIVKIKTHIPLQYYPALSQPPVPALVLMPPGSTPNIQLSSHGNGRWQNGIALSFYWFTLSKITTHFSISLTSVTLPIFGFLMKNLLFWLCKMYFRLKFNHRTFFLEDRPVSAKADSYNNIIE